MKICEMLLLVPTSQLSILTIVKLCMAMTKEGTGCIYRQIGVHRAAKVFKRFESCSMHDISPYFQSKEKLTST